MSPALIPKPEDWKNHIGGYASPSCLLDVDADDVFRRDRFLLPRFGDEL